MAHQNLESIFGLSPQQKGMLFEALSAPGVSGIHVEQEVYPLNQGLNFFAFQEAWRRLFERHAIFRTAFVWKDQEEPFQVVFKRLEPTIICHDWQGISPVEQDRQLHEYLNADRKEPFNLTRAPGMRLALFRSSEFTYYFVWTQHHILMDGWCRPLIFKELVATYLALCRGEPLAVQPERPYRDYVTWVNKRDLSAAEQFWRRRLMGFTEPTALGVRDVRPWHSDGGPIHAQQEVVIDTGIIARLESSMREHHLTLNTISQGLWALLLSRYSGRDDVAFGATVSGRSADIPNIESMLGLFINTLPVRLKVPAEMPMSLWLTEVQREFQATLQYEYCSSGMVHQWSEVPPSAPIYESVMVFENYPEVAAASNGTPSGGEIPGRSIGARTRYALTLLVSPGSGLAIRAVYDRRRLDAASVVAMLEHLTLLWETVAATPHLPVHAVTDRIPESAIPPVRPLERLAGVFESPRTPTEETLTRIWSEVLGLERIGVHEEFLELGGHSLLATQLISRASKAFGVELPLHVLFENGTIAKLAAAVEEIILGEIEQLPEDEARRLVRPDI